MTIRPPSPGPWAVPKTTAASFSSLVASRDLVQRMGGNFTVTSLSDAGCSMSFTLWFPPGRRSGGPMGVPFGARAGSWHVLLVENDQDNVKAVNTRLHAMGHTASLAHTARRSWTSCGGPGAFNSTWCS